MRFGVTLAAVVLVAVVGSALSRPIAQYADDTQKFTAGYILMSAARNGQV
jgi:uncharacterized membrane protein